MRLKLLFIEKFILFVIFVIPIFFLPQFDNVFELPKSFIFNTSIIIFGLMFIFKITKEKTININIYGSTLILSLYFGLNIISYFYSQNKYFSLNFLIYNFAFYFWFLALTNTNFRKEKQILFFNVLILSGLLVAIYALVQHLGMDFIEWDDPNILVRSTSTLGNPDFLGAFLALVLISSVFFFLYLSKFIFKIFYFFSSLLIFLSLLFTYARGSWFSFLGGFLILFLSVLIPKDLKKVLNLSLMFLGFMIIFFLVGKKNVIIDNQKTNLFNRVSSLSNLQYPSILIRKYLIKDSLFIIRDKPVFGWGINTFTYIFPKYRSPILFKLAGRTNIPEHPHNEYLFITSGIGLVGFFIFCWLIIYILLYPNNEEKQKIPLNLILKTSLLIILFQNIFYYLTLPTTLLFFTYVALIALNNEKIVTLNTKLFFSNFTFILLKITAVLLSIFLFLKIFMLLMANFYYRQGSAALHNNNKFLAVKNLIYATSLEPTDIFYAQTLGNVYYELATKAPKKKKYFFKKAEEQYKNLQKLYPKAGFIYASFGRIYFEEGIYFSKNKNNYWNKASKQYTLALKYDKNNPVFLNEMGIIFLNKKNYSQAKNYFKEAIKIDNSYPEPYANLSSLYLNLGNKKLSLHFAYYANKLNPTFIQPLIEIALKEIRKNNFVLAKKILLFCQQRLPQDKNVKELIKMISKIQKEKTK